MPDRITEVRRALLAKYPETAEAALGNVGHWRGGALPFVNQQVLSEFLERAPLDLIHESFWRNLPFGTGGVRGTVGFGPNRINPTVVALTIQAHCDFLTQHLARQEGLEPSVVLANDVRVFYDRAGALRFMSENPLIGLTSRDLSKIAASVYAANGFTVHMVEPENESALLTTPELSFLIKNMRAAGGINMSASHNPPDDNGIKVYDEFGGQYLPPYDQQLTDLTQQVTDVRMVSFEEARRDGSILELSPASLGAYLDLYLDKADAQDLRSRQNERILFTPLCGCGDRSTGAALRELGYDVHVPENQRADGTFEAIPLLAPNPEVAEAMEPARRAAELVGAQLVISCDPDADRVGVEVLAQGRWVHLTGNQIATIIAYRLLLDPSGPKLRGGVYQTIVTTAAVRAIAEKAGCQHIVDDLLVGFKYIGAAVQAYAKQQPEATEEDLLAFAAEESHGYLVTPRLRDKDALSAALYLARLHEDLAADASDLVTYLERVYRDVGAFGDRGRAFSITGSAGVAAISRAMGTLRETPPGRLGGRKVLNFIDYWNEAPRPEGFGPFMSATDRDARNILVFEVAEARITMRPSGTEPKLKFYVSTSAGADGAAAQRAADDLATAVYVDLAPLFDVDLSPVAARLPDVIPIELKLAFDRDVLGAALAVFADETAVQESLDRWLQSSIEPLIPGDGKLGIAGPALLDVSVSWPQDAQQRLQSTLESVGRSTK